MKMSGTQVGDKQSQIKQTICIEDQDVRNTSRRQTELDKVDNMYRR